jgi:hypothetical protein
MFKNGETKACDLSSRIERDQQVWIHVACVIDVAVQMWLLGFIKLPPV